MGAEQLRTSLIQQIQTADERYLRIVEAVMEAVSNQFPKPKEALSKSEENDPIIGYDADGVAVSASVAKAQFAEDLSKPELFIDFEGFARELEEEFPG